MGLKDSLKRSLGFEVDESNYNEPSQSGIATLTDFARDISSSISKSFNKNVNSGSDISRNYHLQGTVSEYDHDYYDYSVSPEHSLYELILIRLKTVDDINYVVDQVLDNDNPVIIDLSFLQRESPENFKLARERIKKMRTDYGVVSFLISKCNNRNRIIIAPKSIKIIKKG